MLDDNTMLGNLMRGNMQTGPTGAPGGLSANASPQMAQAMRPGGMQRPDLWQRMHDRHEQQQQSNPWSNPMLMAMMGPLMGGMTGGGMNPLLGGITSLIQSIMARSHK